MQIGHVRQAQYALLVLLAFLSGCSGGLPYDSATVTGIVTYQGKPLDHGKVIFVPQEGTRGPQAVGVIQSDGSYEMHTGYTPGVAVGQHRVTVQCREQLSRPEGSPMEPVIPPSLIPKKYGHVNTTPLTCEIEKGEKRVFNITLE